MALEKKKKIRKIEIIFVDDEINPVCHCEYELQILEDGIQLAKNKHRENMNVADAKGLIQSAKVRSERESP